MYLHNVNSRQKSHWSQELIDPVANLVANVVHGANADGGDVEVLEVLRKASPHLDHQENDHLLAHDPHERRPVLLAQRTTVPSRSRSRSGIIGRLLSKQRLVWPSPGAPLGPRIHRCCRRHVPTSLEAKLTSFYLLSSYSSWGPAAGA